MTTIERQRFIADLSSRQIPARDLPASLTGMGSVEIDALSGSDHVFNRPEEYGALYDRLVALESADRSRGVTGDLDRARAVYARFTSSGVPAAPVADPSARPRSTGIGAPLASTLVPPILTVSSSSYVRSFGQMNAEQLRPAAQRNVLGVEAGSRTRILAESERVAQRIEGMEARARSLPAGSAERAAIERDIETEVRMFENMVASERAYASQNASNGAPRDLLRDMTRRLPPYLRESIEREGIVIPGMPGAIRPSYSPAGGGWGIKF